ncbi:somatomedin-B and thrombospondin type-1 domain-containing protein-like [Amphiura filiformis]|uniref:somatomedin-B and thrombospondin type-1 domain-containing protein-like n=1 Tax=Amphiura filiformis TaxID=82378 RepID=UPI003B2164A2
MKIYQEALMEVVSLVMLTFLVSGVFGGCRDGGPYGDTLCCQGKDLSCRTDGYVQGQRFYSQCYCDSACVENEDCCSDYRAACPSVDCEQSDWSFWSGCSVNCGIGVQERRRYKIKDPVNAGVKCGQLREIKACYNTYCGDNEIHGNSVALILPHYYGEARDNPELNIMTNFLNLGEDYCVNFKVTNYHKKGCRSKGWPDAIYKGVIVCVQCEYPAYGDDGRCYGEGIRNKKSRWSAVDVPRCRGSWKQQQIIKDCTCRSANQMDFIFI